MGGYMDVRQGWIERLGPPSSPDTVDFILKSVLLAVSESVSLIRLHAGGWVDFRQGWIERLGPLARLG